MRRISALLGLVLLGLLVVELSDLSAQKKMKKELTVLTPQDLKWEEVKDTPPGTMVAPLWGDMNKGGYGFFLKLAPGTKFALHYHPNDIRGVVVSGMMRVTTEDGKKYELTSGSYAHFPAGLNHVTEIGPEGIIWFEQSNQKFGTTMVEEKPVKK